MARKELFKPIDDGSKKVKIVKIRMSDSNKEKIETLASQRKMSTSEFMLRAALGRETKVDFDTDLVLGLSDVTRAIRQLHEDMVKGGAGGLAEELRPIIQDVRHAILRVVDSK